MAVRNVVAPAPQPEPASRLMCATRDVSFFRIDSRCRRYVSDLSNSEVFGLRAEGQGFVVEVDFQLTLIASFLLRWKTTDTVFVVLNFSFKSGGIHLVLPCPWSAPLPPPANLHQHA